jgi:hypothetical protein
LLQGKHLANGDQWKDGNAEYRETHALTAAMFFPNTVVGSVIGLHPSCTGQPLSVPSTTAVCQYRQLVLLQSSRTPCNAKVQHKAECVHTGKMYFSRALQPLEYKSQNNKVFYEQKNSYLKH